MALMPGDRCVVVPSVRETPRGICFNVAESPFPRAHGRIHRTGA